MKTCIRCLVEKEMYLFPKREKSKDGHAAHCKECAKAYRDKYRLEHPDAVHRAERKYKEKNRDKAKAYIIKYRAENREKYLACCRATKEKNPKKYMLIASKMRALKKGFEFSITENDIEIPEFCPVLGIPLKRGLDKKRMGSPSIDRIDNNRGYVPGNVAVISWRANMIKSIGTPEEHESVAKWMRKVSHGKKSNLSAVLFPLKSESPAFRRG